MEILEIIKRRRKALKISQDKMANLLGMARSSYQAVESGKNNMNVFDFFKIINFLRIPITDFVNDKLIVISSSELSQLKESINTINKIIENLSNTIPIETIRLNEKNVKR